MAKESSTYVSAGGKRQETENLMLQKKKNKLKFHKSKSLRVTCRMFMLKILFLSRQL